jgi:hypothetical protein
MPQDVQYAYAVTKAEFNPASLTGSFQAMNGSGFDDSVRIWKLYNGSTTASIEISFDGVTAHDFIPPLGTLIVDFQANHDAFLSFGTGVKQLRKGQIIWGRTASNPTYLQIIGYQ